MPITVPVGSRANTAPAPLMMELDRGVQLPAAMVETGQPMTNAQSEARRQVADAFSRDIHNAVNNPSGDAAAIPKAWTDAQAAANQRYKLLFGDAAFNRASVSAGLDALTTDQ